MKKAKLALTALMIGTMSLSGVSFAEASALDSLKIVLNIGADKAPSHQEKPEPPRQPEHRPAPKPVMQREPQRGPQRKPEHREPRRESPQPRNDRKPR